MTTQLLEERSGILDLELAMTRLTEHMASIQSTVTRPSRAYLESLPELWAKTSDAGRHAIAEAVFERIDVLGVTDYTFTLTAHAKARGWDAAFSAGVVGVKEGQSGRGERDSPATTDLPVTMRLAEPPEPFDWLRSA